MEEIEELDLKLYAGLDSEILKELDKMEFLTISETPPDFKQIILLFVPEEIEEIKKMLDDIDVLFSGDEHFIASRKHYDEVFRLLVDVKKKYSIVNNPTAFMKVMELAKEHLAQENLEKIMPQ